MSKDEFETWAERLQPDVERDKEGRFWANLEVRPREYKRRGPFGTFKDAAEATGRYAWGFKDHKEQ